MNDTVTIQGNVGGDPVRNTTPGGAPVLNFRVASAQGYRDRRTGNWIETGTNWYSVSAFHHLAETAKVSLRSGDAVIVTGRLKLREWQSNGRQGFSADIVADSIGHDLARGTSVFARTPRPAATAPIPEPASRQDDDPAEAPADDERDDDVWAEAGLHSVDSRTGEVVVPGAEHEPQDEDDYADA